MSNIVPIGNPRGLPDQFRPGGIGASQVPEGYPETVSSQTGLHEYLAILRRHIGLVLGAVAIAVGFTLYVVLNAAPLYRAVAVVRLADARRSLTGSAEGPASEILGHETDILQSQMQVLTSRSVIRDAVDRAGLRLKPAGRQWYPEEITTVQVAADAPNDSLHLTFGPEAVSGRRGTEQVAAPYGQPLVILGVSLVVSRRPSAARADFIVTSRDAAANDVLGRFKVVGRPKTDIIDLSYVGTDPRFAQRVVNAMAAAFQEHNASTAQQTSRRRRIFLEEQMRATDAMLQKAMNDYSGFRSRQQVFSSKEKGSAQEQGMVSVEMRRADLDAQRRTYQTLLGQAQRNRGQSDPNLRALVSSPGIAANPVVQQLYAQLSAYETTVDSLLTTGAAETNPDVQALRTMISSTSGRLIGAIRNQVTALDASIASLDNLKARSTAEMSSAPATETEEAQLGQQVQAVQKIADQLQEEYQKAKMAEAVEVGQVEIVDLADVPTMAVSAGRVRKIGLGLILGLMVGVGAAILVDGMNTSIRRRDDIERSLQVPGLAVIPKFVTARSVISRTTKLLNGPKNGSPRKRPVRAEGLITVHDPRSPSAEAFRTLRTNLIFSQAVQSLRSIVITSASPGEGKTTTAANLAVSFAQQGMRVLIVDCDLRRARLHKVFGVSREPGLTDYLLGNSTHEDATVHTEVPGLYVMPSGPLPPNPAELLGAKRMTQALSEMGEAFDLVILDSPPLLAASDGAILATMVDGVILVVRAGSTQTDAAQQAIQQLSAVGARLVGAVLNDPDSKLAEHGGYYSYDYSVAET